MEDKQNRTKKRARKNKKNIIIVLFLVLAALGIFLFYRQVKGSMGKDMTKEEINEKSYNSSKIMRADLNDIKTIKLDLKTTDVRIQRSTTNPYIEYTNLYKGEDHAYEVKLNFVDGNLDLSTKIKGDELYMKNKIQIVRIFLPQEGAIEDISGTIGAGELKISDLESKNVNINMESGNIYIENSFFNGDVTNKSGSIKLVNTEVSKANLKTKVGAINAEGIKMRSNVSFETETGDINIKTDDPIDSFDIRAKLNVGNFILGNISYRNILDGYKTDTNSKKKISLKTKIGDIIFNRGEGAVLEDEEYYSSPMSEPSEEDLEDYETPVDQEILEQNSLSNESTEEEGDY
jgi:hypothetical protein